MTENTRTVPTCLECQKPTTDMYRVEDAVWATATLEHERRGHLHLACIEFRLERRLEITDFPNTKANAEVHFGYRMRASDDLKSEYQTFGNQPVLQGPYTSYSPHRKYVDRQPKLRIALDFDETIAERWPGKFPGPAVFDAPPLEGAFAFIQELLFEGHVVILHSVRLNEPRAAAAMRQWFVQHGMPASAIAQFMWWTLEGKPWADVYFDDRAYRFTGTFPSVAEVEKLVTHV